MANEQQQRKVKWDEKLVASFVKGFNTAMEQAEKDGVPMPVMEAVCRDWLASLDAIRQAAQLARQFEAMGVPAFQRPKGH